jgi:hypothetical protein
MRRLIKAIFLLAILGFVALTAYAYLGDYGPRTKTVVQPVVLDVD